MCLSTPSPKITILIEGQVSPILVINNVEVMILEDTIHKINHRKGCRDIYSIIFIIITCGNNVINLACKIFRVNRKIVFLKKYPEKHILTLLINNRALIMIYKESKSYITMQYVKSKILLIISKHILMWENGQVKIMMARNRKVII